MAEATHPALGPDASRGGRGGGAPSARPRRTMRERRRLWPYGFVLPAIVALAAAFVYPLIEVIRFSFYSGSLGNLIYVGTANYDGLWQDPVFVGSLLNNIKLLATVPIMTILALIIALVLNAQIRGWRQYRAIVFLPYILPATAIGLTFSFLLAENGVLNTQLRDWHLGFLAQDWLGSATHVVPTIGSVIIWQQLGFGVVVFAAALLAVPQELVEAARIDGATGWQIQWSILLPQIRRVIEFFMIVEAITVLSAIFTYVYVLTKGGPADSSSVMEYYIFNNGFDNGAIGLASAAVDVLLLLASVLIVTYLRLRARSADAGR
ncbi:MAG: sugar ABC transporter permease [Proteobacteria bacterium]|nr:sugar ABC transporter permease [Pseudomonadota bacterium]